MSEASASAMLVGTPEMLDERFGAVTTTLPRSEIENALAADPPADLVLEILRNVDGGTEAEKRTLRVEWARADLESVLASPDAQAITFSFVPSEIERALDEPEVEGHGLARRQSCSPSRRLRRSRGRALPMASRTPAPGRRTTR